MTRRDLFRRLIGSMAACVLSRTPLVGPRVKPLAYGGTMAYGDTVAKFRSLSWSHPEAMK
jgi:hypothetical protein